MGLNKDGAFTSGKLSLQILGARNITSLTCAQVSESLWNVSMTIMPGINGTTASSAVRLGDAYFRSDLHGGSLSATFQDGDFQDTLQVARGATMPNVYV